MKISLSPYWLILPNINQRLKVLPKQCLMNCLFSLIETSGNPCMASQTGQKCIEIGMRWLRTVNAI